MSKHTTTEDRPVRYDHYEIVKPIGQGAMGTVYLARDVRIGRLAALKTLRTESLPDPESDEAREFLARFKREAKVCGSLVHPNIVTLYEIGYSNEQIRYLAMEYVEGESLLARLRREGRLEVGLACHLILDILSGLDYAHERGVIHRDIKPANVLISERGHAKIADFGVARSVREGISHVTKAGDLLGTPYYMAPEQIDGRGIDERADLFSVGVLFYETLCGRRPFRGKAIMEVLYDVVNHPEPPLRSVAPDLPRWCEQYVARLLRKNPKDRFPSGGAASEELERLLGIHNRRRESSEGLPALAELMRGPRSPEDTPTLPIHSPRARWRQILWSPIPVRRAMLTIAIFVTIVAAPLTWMGARALDDSPTAIVSLEIRQEAERKKQLLEEARVLMEAGAYGGAVERYELILAEYPGTPSAERGREEALTRIFQLRSQRSVP